MNNKVLVLGVGTSQIDIMQYLKDTAWWILACSYQHIFS